MSRIKIGISIGDTNGIGPELIVRAFQNKELRTLVTPVIYGSSNVLNAYRRALRIDKFNFNVIEDATKAQVEKISLIECCEVIERVEIGKATPQSGKAAYDSLARATKDLKEGLIDGLVTLPIDKSNIQNDDFKFPGHTEYLKEQFEAPEVLMFMVSDHLRVGVVTGHIPLGAVAQAINKEDILKKLKVMNESLRMDFNIVKPKIAVLGLNPHAGDNDLLGEEDSTVIRSAIRQAEKNGLLAVGPFPADSFFSSDLFTKFDAVLAMYHDQGLIPFKTMVGFEGVNFTAGLPVVRTSPDHGVAFEISGKGTADKISFLNAIYVALDVARNRGDFLETKEDAMVYEKRKDRSRREYR